MRLLQLVAGSIGRLFLPIAIAVAAVLASCSESTGPEGPSPDPIAPVEVSIAETLIVLTAVGEWRTLTATTQREGVPVASGITWWSRVDSIVRVSLTGSARARGPGRSVLYAVADSGGIDSVAIFVDPLATGLEFVTPPTSIISGRTRTLKVVGFDSAGHPTVARAVTFAVDDTSIATVNAAGNLTGRAPGSTTVRAVSGALSAATPVTITPLPRLRFAKDSFLLAVGARNVGAIGHSADSLAPDEFATVTVTVEDTTVASATPTLKVPRTTGNDPILRFEGRGVGTTRVRLSAPGWSDAEAVIVVRRPQLNPWSRTVRKATLPGGGGFSTQATDTSGQNVDLVQTHWVRFTSLDTTIFTVVNDSASMTGEKPAATPFVVKQAGTGMAVASADGFRPETLVLLINNGGFYHYSGSGQLVTVPLGHRASVRLGSSGYCVCNGTPLDVVLTQTDPSVVRLPTAPTRLTPFEPLVNLPFDAIGLGRDTVFASAPGHAPDTIIVDVTQGGLRINDAPSRVAFTWFLQLALLIPDEPIRGVPTTLRVQSSAPDILLAESEYATIPFPTTSVGVPLRLAGPGTATLTVTDTSGFYTPLVVGPITVERVPLYLYAAGEVGDASFDLGVRQRRVIGVNTDFGMARKLGGRLRSSDPSVVRLTTDTFPSLATSFEMIAGDVPGTAWIVATARGFQPDSVKVNVTRGRAVVPRAGDLWRGSPGASLTVTAQDENGHLRVTEDSLFLTVRSMNRDRLLLFDSIAVIPAGASSSNEIRYVTGHLGPVAVAVTPRRPLAPFVETGSTVFVVIDPLAPRPILASPAPRTP